MKKSKHKYKKIIIFIALIFLSAIAVWIYHKYSINNKDMSALCQSETLSFRYFTGDDSKLLNKEDVWRINFNHACVNNLLPYAEKGYKNAQYELGKHYYEYCKKETFSLEDHEAEKWLLKAAMQKDIASMEMLGEMYSEGNCVKRDFDKAAKWYQAAISLGSITAQDKLNQIQNGPNKNQDIADMDYLEREYFIYKNFQGDCTSEEIEKYLYAIVYNDPNEKIKDFTNLSEEEYRKYEKLANKGDNLAQLIMGDKYYKGIGTAKDYKKAFEYFSKASGTQRCAEVAMGNMYFKGEGVEKDIPKAIKLWTKDVDNEEYLNDTSNDMISCFSARLEYANLLTYPIEAIVLFESLAKQGDPKVQSKLGELYNASHSDLLSHEIKWISNSGEIRAEYWFKKAVAQNYRDAYIGLARLYSYYYGPGTYYTYYHTNVNDEDLLDQAFKMGSIWAYNAAGDDNFYHYHAFAGVLTRVYDTIGEEDSTFYPVNFKKAFEYYSKTANLGDPYGLYHIGLMYDGGYGVDKDPKKAFEYYQKAIKNIDFISDMRPTRMAKMYQQFGERLIELGKKEEAKIVLNKSIELGKLSSKKILEKIK